MADLGFTFQSVCCGSSRAALWGGSTASPCQWTCSSWGSGRRRSAGLSHSIAPSGSSRLLSSHESQSSATVGLLSVKHNSETHQCHYFKWDFTCSWYCISWFRTRPANVLNITLSHHRNSPVWGIVFRHLRRLCSWCFPPEGDSGRWRRPFNLDAEGPNTERRRLQRLQALPLQCEPLLPTLFSVVTPKNNPRGERDWAVLLCAQVQKCL